MKKLLLLFSFLVLQSCEKKENIDFLIVNAKVYTLDKDFTTAEAFAVKDGKIVKVGSPKELKSEYQAKEIYDAEGKTVVPGLIDAHAHFYGLGLQQQKVDLTGTKSFEEVVQKIVNFQEERNVAFITGRGWDQNDWKEKEFPTKDTLDQLFPDTPIAMTRIDGHAMLVNSKALEMANITPQTKVEGGEIKVEDGELTGILIDNPMGMIERIIPEPNKEEQIRALLEAQEICLDLGLTTVDDAGLSKETIQLIDSLQQSGDLKIRIYAMVRNHQEDLDYFLKQGILKTERLHVRSVKVYADGALGSRGAALKEAYTDQENHFGAFLIGVDAFKQLAERISQTEFQMNTHAIGDSANLMVLKTYDSILKNATDKRWRVEHAQIIDEPDFDYFDKAHNILPSVQPTHATSDMYWAEDRVGEERIKNAYAYKKLLEHSGMIALGTDFPIEKVSPILTFYAAVARQDLEGFPEDGFQNENALTREEALRGMTIWAAYANFEEKEKGSIEAGKLADFVILDQDLMTIPEESIPEIKVMATFIGGEKVN